MAIEKEYDGYIPVCDGCLQTLDKCGTFQDALDHCKENGWQNVKIGHDWQNRCPKCHIKQEKRPRFLDW